MNDYPPYEYYGMYNSSNYMYFCLNIFPRLTRNIVCTNPRLTRKALPNWNCVKCQLKFDKPRYLFTKTHKPKTKTHLFYDKNNALYNILYI